MNRAMQFKVTRFILVVTLLCVFGFSWISLNIMYIAVVGQPSTTGAIQSEKEQPFFESLPKETGLPIQVDYKTVDISGYKDNFQLRMMREGVFDMASLRFLQNASEEPSIYGLDLVGLNDGFEMAKSVTDAYTPFLADRLKRVYGVKLLGVWPFGPQVFFCYKPIQSLRDIKGLKVRVGSAYIAEFIDGLGGVPIIFPFGDVKDALEKKILDCAITSATSGHSAGWTEHTRFIYPLATQMGLNGIGLRLELWNRLNERQRKRLHDHVNAYIENIWKFAQTLEQEALNCATSNQVCKDGKRTHLILVPVAAEDKRYMKSYATGSSLSRWMKRCDEVDPQCSIQWRQQVAPLIY